MEEGIDIKNAQLGYNTSHEPVVVLESLNLSLQPGQLVAIAGMNGTGKSTLLKSIGGLLPILEGDITVNGVSVKSAHQNDLAKKISLVLTEKIGGFNLTCFDAVAAGQMPYTNAFHQLKEENLKIIREAIETCRLGAHSGKALHELSDGLFQKTMIARALAQQTPLMLLDEPTAYLDYASRHELFLLLQELALQRKKCILVSSHDLDLVLKYCDTILVVHDKRAELVTASEALKNEAFIAIGGKHL